MTYRNPIISGFNPDPSIICIGDDYFLATSTFEYFPGVPIYHSKDLINWKLIGHALNRRSQLDLRTCPPGGGVFAPTLRYHDGKVYMTTTSFNSKGSMPRGFYVMTDDIWDESKWSDPIFFDCTGIDQDLFWDDDGKAYFSTTTYVKDDSVPRPINIMGTAVYCMEVDMNTGRLLTRPKIIRVSDGTLGNGISEGSHIFKRGEYYYLITAEGGTEVEHQEWIFRSKEGPLGPWEMGAPGQVNPLIYNGDHPEVRQTGHMDMIEGSDGRWWAVFLGVRPQKDGKEWRLSQLGRETFLAPVEWKDGWPIVNSRKPIGLEGIEGTGLSRLPREDNWRDDFTESKLGLGWYHYRTPLQPYWSLPNSTSSPSGLTLYSGPIGLHDDEAPPFILRKQSQLTGTWTTEIDFDPDLVCQEAGTAVWWSKYCYASIGVRAVTKEGGGVEREIVLRHTDPDSDEFIEIHKPYPATQGSVKFLVQATPLTYIFHFGSASDDLTSAATKTGEVPAHALVRTRPFDSIFTGMHFGLYAVGPANEPCLKPARFVCAEWRGLRD